MEEVTNCIVIAVAYSNERFLEEADHFCQPIRTVTEGPSESSGVSLPQDRKPAVLQNGKLR